MKKQLLISFWVALSSLVFTASAGAQEAAASATTPSAPKNGSDTLGEQFDSLGGNKIFLEKARALEPEKRILIVQNRTVPLTRRVEIAPEFSGTFGGDTYSRTKNLGLNAFYHFNPRWAVGVKYNYSFNSLTPEGEALVDRAYADYQKNPATPTVGYPKMDYQKSETMALVNWAPFYGKLNLLDQALAHFDFYFVGGYGQVELSSGTTRTTTAGAGFAFWLHQHLSTRLEMRYQNFTAKYFDAEKKMDLAVASIQVGWLL